MPLFRCYFAMLALFRFLSLLPDFPVIFIFRFFADDFFGFAFGCFFS